MSGFQFFFDGVSTTASMISTAVYFLAQNPDMQERAYDEIQVIFALRNITYFSYLE